MGTKIGRRVACALIMCTGIVWGTAQWGTHATAQAPAAHVATGKAPGPLGAIS